MKSLFFVVNNIVDFDFGHLVAKHLDDCSISVGTQLPAHSEEYDLIVLWNYRKKIAVPESSRNIVVFHGANLPEGRGFAPIYNSIAKGLEKYTLSGIFAADEVDQGDIIVQASFTIDDHYVAADLRRWDTEISLMLTRLMLERLDAGPLRGKPQEGIASWWPRRRPEDNEIDIRQPFSQLIPHLRACEEGHPAFFMLNGVKYLVQVKPEAYPDFPSDLEIVFFDSGQ